MKLNSRFQYIILIALVLFLINAQNVLGGSSEFKNLSAGESWDIGNGYTITAVAIDAKTQPAAVRLEFSESGRTIDTRILGVAQSFIYDKFTFVVMDIWRGKTSDIVSLSLTLNESVKTSRNLSSIGNIEYFNIWKYKTKLMPGVDIARNSVAVAVPGDGISLLDIGGTRTLYKKIHNNGDISISPDGDYIAIYKYIDNKFQIDFLDNKGNILWSKTKDKTGEAIVSLDVSLNGKYVAASEGTHVYLFDRSGRELFDYASGNVLWGGIAISDDGNLIIAGGKGQAFAVNENGRLVWTRKYGEYITINSVAISPDGKYNVINAGNIEVLDTTGKIISKFSVAGTKVSISSKGDIAVQTGNSVNIYDIEGKLVSSLDNNLNARYQKISSDGYFVAVGGTEGVYMFAKEGYQTAPSKEIIETVAVEDPQKTNYITIVAFLIGIVIAGIVVRPFYKRAKLKKEMAKTPTDWCPHCKKFTGGAKVCPHCGKETLLETKYETAKKVKKK